MSQRKFYVSHLSDAGLQKLFAYFHHCYDEAPTFYAWLHDVLSGERLRRASEIHGRELSPLVLSGVPSEWLEWSNADIAQALKTLTAASYAIGEITAKDFIDHLVIAIGVLAAFRLTEEKYDACIA